MAEEEAKKVEVEVTKEPEPAPAPAPAPEAAAEPAKEDVAEEKAVIPATEPPAADEKPPADDSKALAIVESEYTHLALLNSLLSVSMHWKWKACDGKVVLVYWSVLSCARNWEKLPSSDLSMLGSSVVPVLSGSCTVLTVGLLLFSWVPDLLLT